MYILGGRSVAQLVAAGALSVNLTKVMSMEEKIDPTQHLLAGNITLVRIGK